MTLSQRVKKLLGFEAPKLGPSGRLLGHYSSGPAYALGFTKGSEYERARTAALEAALCEAVEALAKIKPGYGLDMTDDVEYQARYWANECLQFHAISREALTRLAGVCDGMEGKE